MTQARVLFVDDDGDAVTSLIRALRGLGFAMLCDGCTSSSQAMELVNSSPENPFHVAVIDLSLDPKRGVDSGFELLTALQRASPFTRVIVLTGHGSDEFGIRALGHGAMSFLEKPAQVPHLLALIREGIAQSALKQRVHELEKREPCESSSRGIMCGRSAVAQQLQKELDFLSTNTIGVFLKGETGVGKSFYARALHRLSQTRGIVSGEFVSYAPRAGSQDLVSSDLFGHTKGAFTGAHEARKGLLSHAHGGTLFLDEIDELPQEVQVTLLTVIQEKRFRPVGATAFEPFDARIIAASNAADIEVSSLRKDLFHRIAQEIVTLPPLRERREDIMVLAEQFLALHSNREGSSNLRFAAATTELMTRAYDWPGNVRELEKAVERAAARAGYERSYEITPEHLPPQISALHNTRSMRSELGTGVSSSEEHNFSELVEKYKIELIAEALRKHNQNQAQAAASLGLDRSTLRRIWARHLES